MGLAQEGHIELETSTAATSLEQGLITPRAEMGPEAMGNMVPGKTYQGH